MDFLIFGAALWAFTLFGLALHSADIQHRSKEVTMDLRDYQKPRPLEWLLASLVLFAGAAVVMGALEVWGVWGGRSFSGRFQVFVGAALLAIGLAYVGVRGASWVHWAKDRFLSMPGATESQGGVVCVRVDHEAVFDARILRQITWPVYGVSAVPLVVASAIAANPFALPIAVFAALGGCAVVVMLSTGLPKAEEDEDW